MSEFMVGGVWVVFFAPGRHRPRSEHLGGEETNTVTWRLHTQRKQPDRVARRPGDAILSPHNVAGAIVESFDDH